MTETASASVGRGTTMAGSPAGTPEVSVIVPFFNNANTLRACIEALRAERDGSEDGPHSLEIILVDNGPSDGASEGSSAGSGDGSADVVAEFDDITVLEEPTPGAYAARNAGLRIARAPIIAFTDADCTVEAGWLAALRHALADPELGLVIGHCRYPDAASLPLRALAAWENAKASYILECCPPANRIAYCNNMAVRTSLFRDLGPFREWLRAGDSEFAHRVRRERPDLGMRFEPGMQVTHHEFLRFRDRARRLRVYTGTNQQIEGFRELGFFQRLAVLRRALGA